ncbi:MAG: hypothetical protein K8R57_10515 [Verrucomicrobia bacterium]|nr:hypothetical protein [Verrucomicrobiota bacterium]
MKNCIPRALALKAAMTLVALLSLTAPSLTQAQSRPRATPPKFVMPTPSPTPAPAPAPAPVTPSNVYTNATTATPAPISTNPQTKFTTTKK